MTSDTGGKFMSRFLAILLVGLAFVGSAAMMAHPILINRPLVVSPLGVKLCRPSEEVLNLLPALQRGAFTKEDGEQVVDEAGNRVVADGDDR